MYSICESSSELQCMENTNAIKCQTSIIKALILCFVFIISLCLVCLFHPTQPYMRPTRTSEKLSVFSLRIKIESYISSDTLRKQTCLSEWGDTLQLSFAFPNHHSRKPSYNVCPCLLFLLYATYFAILGEKILRYPSFFFPPGGKLVVQNNSRSRRFHKTFSPWKWVGQPKFSYSEYFYLEFKFATLCVILQSHSLNKHHSIWDHDHFSVLNKKRALFEV